MKLLGLHGVSQAGNLDEVQRLFRTGEASATDRDSNGMTTLSSAAWGGHLHVVQWLSNIYEEDVPSPVQLADLYSVLRCYGSPKSSDFIDDLGHRGEFGPADDPDDDGPYDTVHISTAHRKLLLQTERAHASPNLLPYRAQRLAFLHKGSDFARIVIPDLQNIVAEYAQPSAEDQLSAAVIAEAAEADRYASTLWQANAQLGQDNAELSARVAAVEKEIAALRKRQLQSVEKQPSLRKRNVRPRLE
jgi:hypothetical protein